MVNLVWMMYGIFLGMVLETVEVTVGKKSRSKEIKDF